MARKHGAALAIDDAHSLGVLGPKGDGTAAHFGMTDEVDIIAGTFSKSLASIGGFVAAREQRHPLPPAPLPAAHLHRLAAPGQHRRRARRARGHAAGAGTPRAALGQHPPPARTASASSGFDIGPTETPIVPVLIGPLDTTFIMWRKLFDAGVFTNPVAPPAVPPAQCRIRTSVMATHTFDQIDFSLEAFAKIGRELGVI